MKGFIRNLVLSLLLISWSGSIYSQRGEYVVPAKMRGVSYPGHIELNWKNETGFTYEIYRKGENERRWIKRGVTSENYYLDFTGERKTPIKYSYRILPFGLSIKDKEANKFEITIAATPYSDEELLDMTQFYTTRYFYDFADPRTGMARERSNDTHGNIVTTGGTGFGIMALIAGVERGYFPREGAMKIIAKIVTFLETAERFHGAWAHWYNADSGEVYPFSKFDDGGDLVETALLTQGLLTAREYLKRGNEQEIALAKRITHLWEGIEWNWYTKGEEVLYWHWSKNFDWKMNHIIRGHDETLITYILALSSPTYPISKKVYENSYKNSTYYYNGKEYYGMKLFLGMEYGGPLFFTHYSFLGLNPNGLKDGHTDYFQQNRNHALIHRAYAIDNPKKHKGFGAHLWGFTSSDDPKVGYTNHHPGTENENGTVSPTAALSSIVYTPKESMEVLKYLYFEKGEKVFGKYGFYDSYNPGMVEGQQVVKSYLAIDQGPIAVMIENYRSGLIWKLFMSNQEVMQCLRKNGFTIDEK